MPSSGSTEAARNKPAPDATDRLTVVVVNHDGGPYIEPNLQSILNQTYRKFRVVWVDSGSTDDSITRVTSFRDDRVTIVRHTANVGPIWIMADVVRDDPSDFHLFLNVASVLAPDCIEKMLGVASTMAGNFGGCFPRILHYDVPYSPYRIRFKRSSPGKRIYDDFRSLVSAGDDTSGVDTQSGPLDLVETDGFWGLACLLDSTMLRRIGIDRVLYNYGEEEDISRRAGRLGYRFYQTPRTWIRYKQGLVTKNSIFKPSPLKAYLSCRNELYLAIRFASESGLFRSALPVLLRHGLRSVAAPSNGKWVARSISWVLSHSDLARQTETIRQKGATLVSPPWQIDPTLRRLIRMSEPDKTSTITLASQAD